MNWLGRIIQKEIEPDDIVLDLGCGIMQATTDILNNAKFPSRRYFYDILNYKIQYSLKGNLKCKSLLGCDIWPDYLKVTSNRYPTIHLKMNELNRFVDNSYDVVICLDVLEHLPYDTANQALIEMKRIARKKVIVYTPSQWKTNEDNTHNAWSLGKNPYQLHQCFVSPNILLEMGFNITYPKPDKNTLGIYTK